MISDCPFCGASPKSSEAIAKHRAKELLRKKKQRIIIPDDEQMQGIHLLNRDDELTRERHDR